MIPLPSGTKIWLVAGITDMRNGFNGLAAKVQTTLKDDPMSGHVFIFRGRNGSQVKLLWSTGDGRKRAARTVLTGMCYSVGNATRQGSSSPTRFIGQSAMTSRT